MKLDDFNGINEMKFNALQNLDTWKKEMAELITKVHDESVEKINQSYNDYTIQIEKLKQTDMNGVEMKINTCQKRKTVHPNDVKNIEDALENLKRSISKLKPNTFNVDVKLPCEVRLDTALENIKQQQQLLNEKDKQIDHYRKMYIPISDKKKEFRASFYDIVRPYW
ncbi:unnamed protein product [Didymodactylos carnosus]|uniref:Uncharacterized protein n=1 Tax=Didymodactylos carnosus TaxID=1234261 RepID=A0A8S2F4Z9_9BILA|nr:unnamed protein product [Didymodactylos carnosus]CAF4164935.1 unnamed protein product [Didymodactylos carnosus]